jgi:hypothetical protein
MAEVEEPRYAYCTPDCQGSPHARGRESGDPCISSESEQQTEHWNSAKNKAVVLCPTKLRSPTTTNNRQPSLPLRAPQSSQSSLQPPTLHILKTHTYQEFFVGHLIPRYLSHILLYKCPQPQKHLNGRTKAMPP